MPWQSRFGKRQYSRPVPGSPQFCPSLEDQPPQNSGRALESAEQTKFKENTPSRLQLPLTL